MLVSAIKREWPLFVGLLLLVASSIYLKRLPHYHLEDFKVVYTLWVFLLIVKGLSRSGFFQRAALFVERGRFPSLKMVLFAFFLSMFVTNDVALFVVVPTTLLLDLGTYEKLFTVVGETLAVNIGSSLVPFGNPQNLYLYFHFNYSFGEFLKAIYPLVLGLFVLLVPFFVIGVETVQVKVKKVNYEPFQGTVYLLFLFLFAVSVVGFLPLWVGLLVPIFALLFDRETLKVDYFLLLTFLVFFGFTDNVGNFLKEVPLKGENEIFWSAVLGSQIFSNVPTALLLGGLLNPSYKDALLWGVNVGGFGTLIASMANLIAYRLYIKGENKEILALVVFHIAGFLFLAVGVLLWYIAKGSGS